MESGLDSNCLEIPVRAWYQLKIQILSEPGQASLTTISLFGCYVITTVNTAARMERYGTVTSRSNYITVCRNIHLTRISLVSLMCPCQMLFH